MISETKISKGYSTVIPAEIRKALGLLPGDILVWEWNGKELRVSPRKRKKLEDIIGLISEGGDALEAKKRIQSGLK
ncbi:MAG: AbrB/MazE/SpoVT family DNA-binding domain-containing protein [Candidatus Syntropharchaeia archaeon]